MERLLQDLRVALRQIARYPGTAALSVAVIALGVGVATTVLALMDAALFRPVPVPAPDRLVWVHTATPDGGGRNFSYPEYREFQRRLSDLVELTASEYVEVALGGESPERVVGILVAENYFGALGVPAFRGRTFSGDADQRPGDQPVVVLAHRLWERRYHADPALVGRSVVLNGASFTVVGIAPPGFEGIEFGGAVQAWLPLATIGILRPAERDRLARHETWLHVVGRLRPGITVDRAGAAAQVVARTLTVPSSSPRGLTGATVEALGPGGMRPKQRDELLSAFSIAVVMAVLLLLVTCANVGNLLLARGLARRREFAARLSLGATRARLVRQLLTESAVIGILAGAASVLAAAWAAGLLGRLVGLPSAGPRAPGPDLRTLALSGGVALLAVLIFGLAPALTASRVPVNAALKEGAWPSGGAGRHRLRDVLVIGQVAVSLTLIVLAGLFTRSFERVVHLDPGFEPRGGVAVSFDLTLEGYTEERRGAFHDRLVERASALPGVRAASVGGLPLSRERGGGTFVAEGATPGPDDGAMYAAVRPDYFRTVGIPLVRGRDFTPRDDASAAPVVIVNEVMADRLWPGQVATGKFLRMGDLDQPLREVVGVVRTARYVRLTEGPYAFAYLPERQLPHPPPMSLVVRAAGDPRALVPALEGSVREVARELGASAPVHQVTTFDRLLVRSAAALRQSALLMGVFGAIALGLAALGLYGVVACMVSARTREIGLRVALGARPRDVRALFLREGMARVGIGALLGVGLSAAAARVLAATLYGLGAADPVAHLGGVALLCLIAVAATYVPARRAARVDPVLAIRHE